MKNARILARKLTRQRSFRQLPRRAPRSRMVMSTARPLDLVFYLAYLAATAGACWSFGFTSALATMVVTIVSTMTMVIIRFWPRRARVDGVARYLPASRMSSLVRGFALGIAVFVVARGAMPIVRYLPIHDHYTDRDRSGLERRITEFVEAKAYDAACTLIVERLARPLSESWRNHLQSRHVSITTDAGIDAKEDKAKESKWQEAIEWAQKYGIDAPIARVQLQALRDRIANAVKIAELERENAFTRLLHNCQLSRTSRRSKRSCDWKWSPHPRVSGQWRSTSCGSTIS